MTLSIDHLRLNYVTAQSATREAKAHEESCLRVLDAALKEEAERDLALRGIKLGTTEVECGVSVRGDGEWIFERLHVAVFGVVAQGGTVLYQVAPLARSGIESVARRRALSGKGTSFFFVRAVEKKT